MTRFPKRDAATKKERRDSGLNTVGNTRDVLWNGFAYALGLTPMRPLIARRWITKETDRQTHGYATALAWLGAGSSAVNRGSKQLSFTLSVLPLPVILACLAPVQGLAQQSTADVIRGRVINDSARAIVGAQVIITRGPDRLVERDTTDATGSFRITFDPGTGDYLVFVSTTGFASARRRVQRQGSEHELTADFTLAAAVSRLPGVVVRAARPVRATNTASVGSPETGASEKWFDGVSGSIPPAVAGDLNAIAETMPNVTVTGSGPSILGAGTESNLTTLNGMGLAATAIPRAAMVNTRVTGTTFDPTRGGFSGANIDVQLGPGDRFYQKRRGYLSLSPSSLQFTDVVGRETGARAGTFRGSFGADGEAIRGALTYNVAIDVAHSLNDPATLLNASDALLRQAGVAPDSASRLLSLAPSLGIALTRGNIPTSHTHDAVSWLGRLDDTRDTLSTRALTSYFTYERDRGLGFDALSLPSTGGSSTRRTVGAQLLIANYLGAAQRVLTQTRLSASVVRTNVAPYEDIPSANILVLSPTSGGATNPITLSLGGGRFAGNNSQWTLEGSNQIIWNTNGRRNHFKAMVWGRIDGLRQSSISNAFGTYSFNSLANFGAGNATSYSRTVSEPARSGVVWNTAAALAHEWSPSRYFSVLYGARLEADGFASVPKRDLALDHALSVRTDVAPPHLHLSPRAGFTYIYNRARDNSNGSTQSPVGLFYRPSTGVIRAGIGEFRDLLRPGSLANASAATGLPNGTERLLCVGAAVPAPDWSMFASNPSSIPAACNDGSGVLADYAPQVFLISPSYDVPRSWRASLDWSSNIGRWLLKAGVLGSYDLSQPSTVDVNFAGTPRFSLSNEGNRAVYVSPGSIDPSSGAVSSVEARRSSGFGSVLMGTSDLRGYGGQLTTTISPDVLKFHNEFSLYTSLSYTLQKSQRQYRGFDGAAFGDPRLKEWAPSNRDAHHIIVLSAGMNTAATGTVTLFARFQSGLPFTPLVAGDVNGDGMSGDRAFIPNPSLEVDPVLAGQLRSLISHGSNTARACITQHLGETAPRNGCRGPWAALLNLQWQPPFPTRWLGRVTPNVYFANVLGGIDQLIHGEERLRGWGSQSAVDPVLLVPYAFDAVTRRFYYTVNPKFADTRAYNTLSRSPFSITLDFSLDLSTDLELQKLRRAVEPVRVAEHWIHRSPQTITATYLSQTSDLYKLVLANRDSLFLSKSQITTLQLDDSVYSARVRAVYAPLGDYLGSFGDKGPAKAGLDSAKASEKAYWKIFWEQPEIVDSAITPLQRSLLVELGGLLAVPTEYREYSKFHFGNPVTMSDEPNQTKAPVTPTLP